MWSLADVFTHWVWFCDGVALCCLCLELVVSSDPLASVGAQACLCLGLSSQTGRMRQIFKIFFFNFYFCVCAHACNALGGQQGASDPLALELKVVVSCHAWMLGTELWF